MVKIKKEYMHEDILKTTSVTKISNERKSVKTTVPKVVQEALDLVPQDILVWHIKDGKITLRKLE